MKTTLGTRILMIEDSIPNALAYKAFLRDESYDITHVENGRQALVELGKNIADVILLDMRLPDMDGMEILKRLAEQNVADRVIVMTSHASVNLAVKAMSNGAHDFLTKPFTKERLLTTLNNLLKHQRQGAILQALKSEKLASSPIGGFIGSSAVMQTLYRSLHNISASDATVMITGESGTGKEVCAEALHQLSSRAAKNFVPLNCAAIPKDLLESEIFGHVKGAFTGAIEARTGAAMRANGGVLFLDEICELDIHLQAKLLRFVQTSEVQPVGSSETTWVDIRILAATNRNPQLEVREGRFREDLFYRLNVVPVHLPPLRDREEDVLEIARHLLDIYRKKERKNFTSFSPEAEELLLRYRWPGNVRELIHCIHRLMVLNDGTEIHYDMLKSILDNQINLTTDQGDGKNEDINRHNPILPLKPLREIELDYIRESLRVSNQSVPQAAALLDISPSTIYRRLKELDS